VFCGLCFATTDTKETTMKKAYKKPALRRLGLLRQVTRFSF
jgi:hypothetical protein